MDEVIYRALIDKYVRENIYPMVKTEVEKAAVNAIRVYAYEHVFSVKNEPPMFSLNLRALHSLFDATKVIEASSIFSCSGLFGKITVFCTDEILRLRHVQQGGYSVKNQPETYYTILNVKENATLEEIKEAYRLLVLKYHPDVNKDKDATEKFLKIKRAYDCLSRDSFRINYDRSLREARRNQGGYKPYAANQNTSSTQNTASQTTASSTASHDATLKKEVSWIWKRFFWGVAIFAGIVSIGLINEKCQDKSVGEDPYAQYIVDELPDDDMNIETVEVADENSDIQYSDKYAGNPIQKGKEIPGKEWDAYKRPSSSKNIQYTETKFSTGDVPYRSYYGDGKFDGSSLSELKIVNYSSCDAVVLLEDKYFGVIRNVFVREGHVYTMKRIPEGRCRIRVMYGNSWNAEKDNGPGLPKGGFMRNTSYSQSSWSDSFDFYSERTVDGINYPTYSVTLHKVINGNMETERINKDEFWSN